MLVELVEITKHFGSVRANEAISLTFRGGELHALLGENGAGKSTLMKILAGFVTPTSGSIRINGRAVRIRGPADAVRLGIGMLYQDPLDFPQLSVLDNFAFGQTGRVSPRRSRLRHRLRGLAESFQFSLDPNAPAGSLTLGERQQLELLRLLALGVNLLILDEPTTGISSAQRELLYAALRRLARAQNKTVVLVSHKLDDVEALCDRATILRLGRLAGSQERPFDSAAMLGMMFGRAPDLPPPRFPCPGAEVLRLEKVSSPGGRSGLTDCTAAIREGEIVGLAGLEGSGQEVFLRVACGLKPSATGSIHLQGRRMTGRRYHDFRRRGVAFLPAARLEEGLVPGLSIAEHEALLGAGPFYRLGMRSAVEKASARIAQFRIKGRPQTPVEELSGGNQQRLLLSTLPPEPTLLLLENPTRGLDVESTLWVWEFLKRLREGRTGIVFATPELDEILMFASRVLVFFNGRIIKDAAVAATDAAELGKAIAGRL